MIVGYCAPHTNYPLQGDSVQNHCENLVLSSSSFLFHSRILGIQLFATPQHLRRCMFLFVCLPFCNNEESIFLNAPAGTPEHLRCSFLLLQCPSCKAAPGVNTPFQVWSYTFPSAARKELYFQVRNCSVLVLHHAQECNNSTEILIMIIREKSPCLCKRVWSPFTMRYPLHTCFCFPSQTEGVLG